MSATSKTGKAKLPLPVVVLIVAFLCPTEFSVYIDGLRIPPHRAALLLLAPIATWKLVMQRGLKLKLFDFVFVLFNLWTVGIFIYHQGDHDGLVYGGSLAVDGLGAYLVARVWLRTHAQIIAALRGMGYAIAAAALIALPETLGGKTFLHDFLRDVTGYVHPTAVEQRLGLTRAYGSFDHPIHYGTFCAALLSLFWFATNDTFERRKRAGLLALATFLGLSSAPILCLLLQGGMLVWEWLTRGTAKRTSMTLMTLTALYIVASCVMTRSPINFIATGMTLDSWTGYYRLQIWEHGLDNVFVNPWTGIGLNDWVRPWWMVSSTVDAFWLVIAMREGIPGIGLIVLAIVLLGRSVNRGGLYHPDKAVRNLARGWFMSLVALAMVGVTVHFWNVLYAFFFFFLGLGGWLADPKKVKAKVKAVASRRPNPRPRLHAPVAPLPPGQPSPGQRLPMLPHYA